MVFAPVTARFIGNNLSIKYEEGNDVLCHSVGNQIWMPVSNPSFCNYVQEYGNLLIVVNSVGIKTRLYPGNGGLFYAKTG